MKDWDDRERRLDDGPKRSFGGMKPLEAHKGKVYYDPRTNQFVQVREIGGTMAKANFTNFYSDAQTEIDACSVPISQEYFEQLEEVKDITKYAEFTSYGWCVKKKNEQRAIPP